MKLYHWDKDYVSEPGAFYYKRAVMEDVSKELFEEAEEACENCMLKITGHDEGSAKEGYGWRQTVETERHPRIEEVMTDGEKVIGFGINGCSVVNYTAGRDENFKEEFFHKILMLDDLTRRECHIYQGTIDHHYTYVVHLYTGDEAQELIAKKRAEER